MLGEVVGSYRITGQIGAGGMGVVYEAEHLLLGRRAAIKVLLPERSADTEIVERFFTEAKATSLIQHPGVVEIFDYGHLANGNAYIVMELLVGEGLGERLKRVGLFSATQAVAIARHIAGLLGEAHRHGIIHRDLKPDNVFLVADPALPRGERTKVLDFGIAKLSGLDGAAGLQTKTGQIMGTPVYMSPEQCRGAGPVDYRSDIYALGCLLYQMLCGRPPFVGEGSGEVIAAHIHVAPEPLRTYQESVPEELEKVVMRLLEKDVDRRYQTMGEVIKALNEAVPSNIGDVEASLAASGHFAAAVTEKDLERVPTHLIGTTLATSARQSAQLNAVTAIRGPLGGTLPKALLGLAVVAALGVSALLLSSDEGVKVPAASVPLEVKLSAASEPLIAEKIDEEPDLAEPEVEQPEKLAAPTIEKVVLTIESEPPGARIYRQSDGVRVGETPFEVAVDRGKGHAAFYLKKSGYRRHSIEIPTNEDSRLLTALEQTEVGKAIVVDPTTKGSDAAVGKKPVGVTHPEPKKPGKNDAIDPFAVPAPSPRSAPPDSAELKK